MRTSLLCFALLSILAACGDSEPQSPAPQANAHSHASGHHGAITSLGTIQVDGVGFAVARHGVCETGKEAAFVITCLSADSSPALTLWVEDANGRQINTGAKSEATGDDLHFHSTPKGEPAQLVIKGENGHTVRIDPHGAAGPIRDGIAAPLIDVRGKVAGWIELKLHDDKGDLELWLSADGRMATPLDLPIDSTLSLSFKSHDNKLVQLRARNTAQNEDEDGKSNNRDGQTNYFIFPGDTGSDADWLMGQTFRGVVAVAFTRNGEPLQTDLFRLTPHTHAAGGHQH